MKKLLFVCAGNVNRSPTVAKRVQEWLEKYELQDNFQVSSGGVCHSTPWGVQVTEQAVREADFIFCMDLSQEIFFARRYPSECKKVYTIGISDQYQPDSEELLELVDFWVNSRFWRIIHG